MRTLRSEGVIVLLAAISALNSLVNSLFRFLFWPFSGLSAWWPMLFISLLTALLMLWIFGKVSRQREIKHVKSVIRGNLLGVRLFQHDVGIVLKMQGKILKDTFRYAGLNLMPMFFLLPPVLLILIQLNLFFAVKPMPPGESTLVKVDWQGESFVPDLNMSADKGVSIETAAVRVPNDGEVWWRVRGERPGSYRLRIRGEGVDLEKDFEVGSGWRAVSTLRSNSPLDLLLYSGEPPLASDSPISAVEIRYPERDFPFWGWKLNWLVVFFILSILLSFAFKGVMGVEL